MTHRFIKIRRWLLGFALGAGLLASAQTAPYVYVEGTLQGSNGTPLPNAVINFTPSQNFYVPNSVTSVQTGNIGGNVAPTGVCLLPVQFYTWTTATPSAALYQCINQAWVLIAGGGSGMVYPGAGVALSTGSAWSASLGVLGSGGSLLAPSGTPGAGKYVDGSTYAWTALPSGVSWPATSYVVISNSSNSPTGLPPQLNLCLGGVAGPVFGDIPCVSSLTTTGTSGAAAFNTVTGALNIPNYAAGGGFTPANGIFAGDSGNDDDGNVIEPTFALTGFTCTGVTCTVTNSGTNNLAAGDWVNMRFSSAWTSTFSAPTDITYSTGYTLFKVLSSGLSSTQFEFSFASSGTCTSTCGSAAKATYNLPFNTANLGGLSGKLTPYVVIPNPVTLQALNTYYSTILHPLSEAVTGQPTYFIFGQLENDAFASGCTSAATIETALQSLWAKAHTDNSSVLVWSTNAVNLGQTGIGVCSSGYQTLIALEQWLPLQGKSAANQASGQYWDGFVDVARVVNDPGNSSLVAGNGGFGPGGVNLAAAKIANVLLSGVSDPLDKRSDYFGSAPGVAAVGNGFMQIPTTDTVDTYQWCSAFSGSTFGACVMALGTLSGYQHLTVSGDSPSVLSETTGNTGNHYPSAGAIEETSSASTAENYPVAGVLAPNAPTGVQIKWDLGRDNATDDVFRLNFHYVGSGSSSNFIQMGLAGVNGLTIDGNGNVVIQGISTSTSPICPNGTGGALTTSGCSTGSSGGLNGTVTYTSSQSASSSDNGKLVIMNCSGACAYTLPGTQPSTTWSAWVMSIGSTTATIALGGGDTFNGSSSVPVLNRYRTMNVWANTATSTDYEGDAPLVAGSNVTFTPASNGLGVAASGGGGTYYQTMQANGSSQTQEPKLNLKSGTNATVSCADNPGASSTDCTVSATGGSSSGWTNITGTVTASGCTVSSGVCTANSSTGTVTFSSIPGTYTHLKIIVNGSSSGQAGRASFKFQFNGDTGSDYYDNYGEINSGSYTAGGADTGVTSMLVGEVGGTAVPIGGGEVTVLNYANTGVQKVVLSPMTYAPSSTSSLTTWQFDGHWNQTSAITSVAIIMGNGSPANWATTSTFSIWGVN